VTGGTQVLSDWIRVRITAAQGSTFIDRMIRLVEGAERQKTPTRSRSTSASGPHHHLRVRDRDDSELCGLCGRLDLGGGAGGAVRDADPDHHRCAVVGDRYRRHDRLVRFNVLAMSGRAVEAPATSTRCCSTRPAPITLGNRQATAFRPVRGVTEQELGGRGAAGIAGG